MKHARIGNVFESEDGFYSKMIIFSPLITALGIATTPSPASKNFTLNFTLTNLPYSADLETPSSRRFISTVKVINHYVSLAPALPVLCDAGDNVLPRIHFQILKLYFVGVCFDRLTLFSKAAA